MKVNENGFTLIEVLVAIAVLSIGILAMQLMQGQSIDSNSTAGNITGKSMLNAAQIEEIMEMSYNNSLLDDLDGDGTDQDPNRDGIDNDDDTDLNVTTLNENFGLHHSECCPGLVSPSGNPLPGCLAVADYCPPLNPGDEFEIYWNIAIDHPVGNTKTINIIVIDPADRRNEVPGQANRSPHRAEYTFIKDDVI